MISNTPCGHRDGVSKSMVKGKRKQTPDHFPKKEVTSYGSIWKVKKHKIQKENKAKMIIIVSQQWEAWW